MRSGFMYGIFAVGSYFGHVYYMKIESGGFRGDTAKYNELSAMKPLTADNSENEMD